MKSDFYYVIYPLIPLLPIAPYHHTDLKQANMITFTNCLNAQIRHFYPLPYKFIINAIKMRFWVKNHNVTIESGANKSIKERL